MAFNFGSPVPLPSKVVSGWFDPRPYRNGVHEGLDFDVDVGTPVYAIGDGVVTTATTSDGPAGKMVVIEHPPGILSRYLHLDSFAVRKGERVTKGQMIGRSGATGIKRSAAHLHFDIKFKPDVLGKYVALFGVPRTGFGPDKYGGIGVPSEPLIPVSKYSDKVLANAASRGVHLYTAVAAGGVGLVTMLAIGFIVWRLLKK